MRLEQTQLGEPEPEPEEGAKLERANTRRLRDELIKCLVEQVGLRDGRAAKCADALISQGFEAKNLVGLTDDEMKECGLGLGDVRNVRKYISGLASVPRAEGK